MTHLNRRNFLSSVAASFAVPTILSRPAPGRTPASDRVTLGVVGLGSRGFNLINDFLSHDAAQIVAICDVDRLHHRDRPWGTGPKFGREPAAAKINAAQARSKSGANAQGVKVYSDYREMMSRDDMDAVVVATPDHWHALCTLTALRWGKDVYCEKPVTHMFREGQLVYREVANQQAIFQTGSQQRSDRLFRRAVQIVRAGILGKVTRIEVGLPPGYDKPQGDTEVLAPPEHIDYDLWCGPAPKLPYMRARHHRWWRGHRAFGGGVLMDWIGHHNDIAHWALDGDRAGPTRVRASGWEFPETDVYDTPAQYTIECQYPDQVTSSISSRHAQGLKVVGEEGWVHVRRGKLTASDSRWVEPNFRPKSPPLYVSDSHTGNFLDGVRTRRECIAPAETAHRSITPGHLGYVSNALGRALQWDAVAEQVTGDPEANQLLNQMDYRVPWSTTIKSWSFTTTGASSSE